MILSLTLSYWQTIRVCCANLSLPTLLQQNNTVEAYAHREQIREAFDKHKAVCWFLQLAFKSAVIRCTWPCCIFAVSKLRSSLTQKLKEGRSDLKRLYLEGIEEWDAEEVKAWLTYNKMEKLGEELHAQAVDGPRLLREGGALVSDDKLRGLFNKRLQEVCTGKILWCLTSNVQVT
jgi:hypothetical protein